MCDPLTATALALSAGGAYVKSREQNNYVNAQNAANQRAVDYSRMMKEQERARQSDYSAKADALMKQSEDQSNLAAFGDQQGASETRFMDTYSNQSPLLQEGMYLSGQQNANSEIQSEIAKRTANATADARARAANLAKLTGYGVANQQQGLGIQSVNDQIRTLQGLRQGSLSVNQQETSVPADNVQYSPTGIGDLMSAAGSVMSFGAGNGMSLGNLFSKGGSTMGSSITDMAMKATPKFGVGGIKSMPAIMY
jgi:hypothetical protein